MKTEEELIAENKELRNMLAELVKMDDNMLDPSYEDAGTYTRAYYSYYKGQYSTWERARRLLENS